MFLNLFIFLRRMHVFFCPCVCNSIKKSYKKKERKGAAKVKKKEDGRRYSNFQSLLKIVYI